MTSRSNESPDGCPAGVAAWLRFADEEYGSGIRAALFETSADGKPLAFFFTRIDRQDSSLRRAENPTDAAIAQLGGALLRAADPAPSLIIGADDGLTRQAFARAPATATPCCLVGEAGGAPLNTFWVAGEPQRASEARRLFDEMMARDASLEPFNRRRRGFGRGVCGRASPGDGVDLWHYERGLSSILAGAVGAPSRPSGESVPTLNQPRVTSRWRNGCG